jgi:hypothetical protein
VAERHPNEYFVCISSLLIIKQIGLFLHKFDPAVLRSAFFCLIYQSGDAVHIAQLRYHY